MHVLVYPATLEIGGSQLMALEMAKAICDLGAEATVFGPQGELTSRIAELGLEYCQAPVAHRFPSIKNMVALHNLVAKRSIDLLHGYEWGPTLDLAYGPHVSRRTPLVSTVMSMTVPDEIPRHLPMIVGTMALQEDEGRQRSHVYLIEPPIDTEAHRSGPGCSRRRADFGFAPDDIVLAIVCRLVPDLGKLDGVFTAIDTVAALADEYPVRLLIAGDGSGLGDIHRRAQAVNERCGATVVKVVGPMLDPRAAYESADIVLGMGSSVLKGMAYARPVVVQGESGFWRLLEPSTLPYFLAQGWWGGRGSGQAELTEALLGLLGSANRRHELGAFGRALVEERFSLVAAARKQLTIYADAMSGRRNRGAMASSLARSGKDLAKFKTTMALRRFRSA